MTTDPQEYAAPGQSAQHEHGIVYQGDYETPWDGTAQAVRLHARALASTRLPVELRSFAHVVVNAFGVPEPVHSVGIPAEVQAEVGHLLNVGMRYAAPIIKHMVVRSAEQLRQVILPRGAVPLGTGLDVVQNVRDAVYANTILYTVWERDRIDPGIVKQLDRVAEIWVPCRHNLAMLMRQGVNRVQVIPHPYDPADPILQLTRRSPPTDGVKRFYAIGRWEPRKGLANLIGAFMTAYGPDDLATLTIKWSGSGEWTDYISIRHVLAHWVSRCPRWTLESAAARITLIGEKIRRSRILELHFRNNIYVSASHGEAWNLPAFEAKLAGNRMVHVPWGGTCDYAAQQDIEVPFKMGTVHPSYGWERDAEWATYEVEALAKALTVATVPQAFTREPEMDRFELTKIGEQMATRVRVVLGERKVSYVGRMA